MSGQKRTRGMGPAAGDLEEALEAYARARLSPSPTRTASARSKTLAQARARLSDGSVAAPVHIGSRRRRIRLVPALLAAAIALAVAVPVTLASSQAGGPLYPVRLWVEDATLPSQADARFDALLSHVQERLDEAQVASASNNAAAVTAALAAYWSTVESAIVAAGNDLSRETRLELVLERHVVVLNALVPSVPANARPALSNAIDQTSDKLEQIRHTGPGSHPGGPGTVPSPTSEGRGPGDNTAASPPAGPPSERPGASPSPRAKKP